jgi:hypothetical protein
MRSAGTRVPACLFSVVSRTNDAGRTLRQLYDKNDKNMTFDEPAYVIAGQRRYRCVGHCRWNVMAGGR